MNDNLSLPASFPDRQPRSGFFLKSWRQMQIIAPPPWVSSGLISLLAVATGDPVILAISTAIWLTLISTFFVGQINKGSHLLTIAHRKWFVPLQVLAIAFATSPFSAFAQATGGGSACSTAGFLAPLATFADQVFTPASGAGVAGGSITTLQSFMCTMIGLFVLAIIIIVVGGIAYVGYGMIIDDRGFSTFGRPVAGMIFTVLLLVSFVSVATTSV